MSKSSFKKQVIFNICNLMILMLLTIFFLVNFFGIIAFPSSIIMIEGTTQSFNIRKNMDIALDSEVVSVLQNSSDKVNLDTNSFSLVGEKEGSSELVLNAFGIPVKTSSVNVIPDIKLVPVGVTVGVTIDMDGVMVLGDGFITTSDGKTIKPCDNILKSGDVIVEVNNLPLKDKNHLIELIEEITSQFDETNEQVENVINFKIERQNEFLEVAIEPVKSSTDNKYKIGCWVRDSTKGIGTITFYDKNTGRFAALGHGILDVDTKKIMKVETGNITQSSIVSITQSKKGSPGELIGQTDGKFLGEITYNCEMGIYGNLSVANAGFLLEKDEMPIATKHEIQKGFATILANIDGNEVCEYEIEIESVNLSNSDTSKGIVIKITDEELINKTNGIVQGMSGSPILQNGKIIGAVTHVFVNDPLKGYGVFIENMLES